MIGNPIVLVNRTSHPLHFTKGGRQFTVMPGRNYGFTSDQVRFAKAQNPLLGTEDYLTRKFESLIGVEGTKDPVDPIPDAVLEAASPERFDRNSFVDPRLRNVEMIRGRVAESRDEVATLAGPDAMAIGEAN